jgi:hypothetical protein
MIGSTVAMVVTDEATRAQVDRILQSKIFRSSEVLRHLFSYLTEKSLSGEADDLKEYAIGLDALGKPSSFDPRQESVVRMHVSRLRQKLAEYYRSEGTRDPIIVDLPKGGFKVTFEPRPLDLPQPPSSVSAATEAPASGWRRREVWLAAGLLIAVTCAAIAGLRLWHVEQSASESAVEWTPELRQLWEPMLSSNRRLVVCISTPLFVQMPGFGDVRESAVDDADDALESKKIAAVEDAVHAWMAEPSYSYTGAGTATGAFLLGRFLAPRKQSLLVTTANLLSWPELTEDNVVFLGPTTGIHQTEAIPVDLQIQLEANGVRNLQPHAGEPGFMTDRPAKAGEASGVTYALISRVPGMSSPGAILMLSGNQLPSVMGGVQAFTNAGLAQMLVSKLKNSSGSIPRYFQVVLEVKSMDNVPVTISYMFHRELSATRQGSTAQRP